MSTSLRTWRKVLFTSLGAVLAVAVIFGPAIGVKADPGDYAGPIFGVVSAPDGSLLVADAGQGIVQVTGGAATLLTPLPGVTDVAPSGDALWAVTSGPPGAQRLYRIDSGQATEIANLYQFEAKRNPHPVMVDSNAFDVADLGNHNEALVADAAGNDLVIVSKQSKPKLVAVLPNQVVSSANLQTLAGCPSPPEPLAFICGLPPMMPAEPVATSVTVGPDGAFYVGELKGFPAPTGASRVWRIEPNARNAQCGLSPLCTVAVEGFTSIIDLAFGPDGRLYIAQFDDSSWAAVEFGLGGSGGSVHACNLATKTCETVITGVPMLTSITFRDDGSLWGSVNALVPGAADVVQLAP